MCTSLPNTLVDGSTFCMLCPMHPSSISLPHTHRMLAVTLAACKANDSPLRHPTPAIHPSICSSCPWLGITTRGCISRRC